MSLSYNEEQVKIQFEKFKNEHPNASKEELEAEHRNIVIAEAILKSAVDSARKRRESDVEETPEQRSEFINKREAEMRKSIPASDICSYFKGLDSPLLEERLEAFQAMIAADKDGKLYSAIKTDLGDVNNKRDTLGTHNPNTIGEQYFRGMFAPVTDSKGMIFKVKANADINEEVLHEWQRQADEVKIDVPDGMNPELVSFVVFAALMDHDNLLKANQLAHGAGSTIGEGIKDYESVRTAFYSNTIVNESRANMHAVRSLVPEARRKAKELLERGDKNEINASLKSAFEELYSQIIETANSTGHHWTTPTRKISELLSAMNKAGIDPVSIGISQDQLDFVKVFKTTLNYQQRIQKLDQELLEYTEKYIFSGYDKQYDPVENHEIMALLQERAALSLASRMIEADLMAMHSRIQIGHKATLDEAMHNRTMSPYEAMSVNDPEAFVELCRRKVEESNEITTAMQTATERDKVLLLNNKIFIGAEAFPNAFLEEAEEMGAVLETLKDKVAKQPGSKSLIGQIEKMEKLRASLGGNYSQENLNKLLGPYKSLASNVEKFIQKLDDDPDFISSELSSLTTHTERIEKQPEYTQKLEAERSIYREAAQHRRTAFSERFNEYNAILTKLTGNKAHSAEYQKFLDSMNTLNNTVVELCEKPKVLESSDIETLKQQYNDAIRDCAAYISIKKPTSLDKDRAFIAKEIAGLLVKDMMVVSGINPDEGLTLSDALEESRGEVLDITDSAEVKSHGNAMSSRIPITYRNPNGTMTKGFFTKNKKINETRNNYSELRCDPDSRIDERNCALSDVADLLGAGKLIAKAQKVTIMKDGVPTEGVFMANATGLDIMHPKIGDAMNKWFDEINNSGTIRVSPECLKQMADMQVIDFICGNADRHQGNMFYQFDNSNPAQPVLTGIVGIDNDYSFGTFLNDDLLTNNVTLDDMAVISESMAERVMNLSPELMEYTLRNYHFSDAEKEAATTRLQMLQTKIMISKGLLPESEAPINYAVGSKTNPLKIVADDQFNTLNVDDLVNHQCCEEAANIFKQVFELGKSVYKDEITYVKKHGEDKEPTYLGAVKGSCKPRSFEVAPAKEKFTRLAEKLEKVKSRFGGNSTEFTDFYNDLKALTTGDYDKKQMKQFVASLSGSSQKYINEKKDVPSTEKGKQRLHLAREIRELCKDVSRSISAVSFGERKKSVTSFYMTAKADLKKMVKESSQKVSAAAAGGDPKALAESFTELAYLSTMSKQFDKTRRSDIYSQLTPRAIRKNIKLNIQNSIGLLSKMTVSELKSVIASDHIENEVTKLCTDYYKNEIIPANTQKAQKNADLADDLLSKTGKQNFEKQFGFGL